MSFREKLARFMAGRYVGDSLNTVLNVLSLVSFFAGMIIASAVRSTAGIAIGWVLYVVALALLGFGIFRTFSRNLPARRAEYEWYRSHIVAPLTRKKNEARTRRTQSATHRFFKCPQCRQTVRVPKGKGTIKIKCPKCGNTFIKKT